MCVWSMKNYRVIASNFSTTLKTGFATSVEAKYPNMVITNSKNRIPKPGKSNSAIPGSVIGTFMGTRLSIQTMALTMTTNVTVIGTVMSKP